MNRACRAALLFALIGPALAGTAAADSGSGCREVELGLGYLSGDEFRYGRFAGNDRDGVFGVLDLLLCRALGPGPDGAGYWRVQAGDLGIDARGGGAEIGEQGRYRAWVQYRALPAPRSRARTPVRGAGGDALALPADWIGAATTAGMARLLPSLGEVELGQVRRERAAGFAAWLPHGWRVESRYRHETRDGLRHFAGVLGNNGGNARAIALPAPVDYRTREADLALRYAGQRLQLRAGFLLSRFDNAHAALRWQGPFAGVAGWHPSAAHPGGIGQAALPPDNRFHQFSLSLGYGLSPRTRLNADIALGRMRQDQDFLPYTVNPTLAAAVVQPLPRASLDGRIDTTLLNLRLASRPDPRWHWNLGWRYDDRDNRTPRDEYVYVPGDSLAQNVAPASAQRRYNLPVGYREQVASANAGYRHSRLLDLAGGIERRAIDRTWSARSDSDETRLHLTVRTRPDERFNAGLRLLAGSRDGAAYLGSRPFLDSHAPAYTDTVAGGFENLPGLRQYHLADRDRRQAALFAGYTPTPAWSFGLSAGQTRDDYDASEFGLQRSRIRDLHLDAGYSAGDWTLHAFAGRERLAIDQAGRAFQGGANRLPQANDPARDWFARHHDEVETLGAGLRRALGSRLSLRVDYAQSHAVGAVDVATGSALAGAPLPDSRARLRTLDLGADWQWRDDATVRLRCRAESFRRADWAVDGIAPDTLANVILLGEDSPDYRVHAVSLSLRWRF